MTLQEEITNLTAKWYKYVNLDHHKDRDCHWYIEKRWSYGDEPYYQAHHYGYVIDNWSSPKCGTAELAETVLRDKLKNEVNSALIHLKDMLTDEDMLDWHGGKDRVVELIKELS
jgi:hypothetical protein